MTGHIMCLFSSDGFCRANTITLILGTFGAAPTTAQRFHFHGDSFSYSRFLRNSIFTFGKHACDAKIIARRSVEFRAGRVSRSNPPTVWTASHLARTAQTPRPEQSKSQEACWKYVACLVPARAYMYA